MGSDFGLVFLFKSKSPIPQTPESANLADLPADHETHDAGRGPGARQLWCQLRGDALAASTRGTFGTKDARRSLSNLDERVCESNMLIAHHHIRLLNSTTLPGKSSIWFIWCSLVFLAMFSQTCTQNMS